MHKQSSALLASALLSLSAFCPAANAVLPGSDALNATIVKSNLFDPNLELIISLDPANSDHIVVSTFLDQSATDQDCKIDSLMIGKRIMELADDVSRVTISFFSRADLSTYKQVSVKSVDIKAFSAGSVNKDELLKNIDITTGQTADSPSNLTALLRRASLEKALQVAVVGQEMNLTAQVDLSRNELNTRLEILQLAQNALAAAPETVKILTVKLEDAVQRSRFKQVSFKVAELQAMISNLQAVLNPVTIAVASGSGVAPGPFEDERQKLFTRIKALEKQGVGVQAFIGLLRFIEAGVGKETVSVLQGNIKRLSAALDEQEQRMVAVKNRVSQLKKEEKEEEETAPLPTVKGKKKADYITLGGDEFSENRARINPDAYAEQLQTMYMTEPVKPAMAKRFASGLQKISDILRENQRSEDATRFQRWAADIRNKYVH